MTVNRKLLKDLGDLAVRYRAKDWEELASWLDDPGKRETLRRLLGELATASNAAPKSRKKGSRKKSPSGKVDDRLRELRAKDPTRAQLLAEIWAKLKSKELLPSLQAVRSFADGMGFKGTKAPRRETAIAELMLNLLEVPGDALESRMRETVVADRQLSAEYEHWVKLILDDPDAPGGEDQASPS